METTKLKYMYEMVMDIDILTLCILQHIFLNLK